jgi:hypothetical protein
MEENKVQLDRLTELEAKQATTVSELPPIEHAGSKDIGISQNF